MTFKTKKDILFLHGGSMFMDTEKLLAPVWETDEMTDEFITMTENGDGDIAGRLLFMPKDIMYLK